MELPKYEVYAVRYATKVRQRSENFIFNDGHDGPMPLDYYTWVIKSSGRVVLVDTGFDEKAGRERSREFLRCPIDALHTLGIDPDDVHDVILTHLHNDHAGNLYKLENAIFHVQDAEVAYATGRDMCHHALRHAYSVEDLSIFLKKLFGDRVKFHDGDAALYPGIELMMIGGHTRGLQAVRVHTERGWIVLASDASHYYDNFLHKRPFPLVCNVADMLSGHARLEMAADSIAHIVPGHDPDVMRRYPRLEADAIGIALLHKDERSQS